MTGITSAITSAALAAFRKQGFVVIPGVLDDRQLACGRRTAAAMLTAEPPPAGQTGPYFLWPRFAPAGEGGHDHGLQRFYRAAGIGELAAGLLRADLPPKEPEFAQLAVTIPRWPHRPGGPHVDGISPPSPDGTPGTFSLLAGAWLTDHSEPDRGNLWVWPGTHLRFGAYLAAHGADALARLHPEPYPPIELGEAQQVTGPAGSVLLAHYLLAHNIGGHDGPAGAPMRQVVYYRLQTTGHRGRWREAVTDPLSEFRAA
ncbi:MAG TPA: phytanoyl-CoA dioxygenase family protein [Streptosporangiaceae bacterium]